MLQEYKELLLEKYISNPKGWYRWLNSLNNRFLLEALNIEYPYLKLYIRKNVLVS